MLEKVTRYYGKANEYMGRTNPDLYSTVDANYAMSRFQDREYTLGSSRINPKHQTSKAKIFSLPPEVLNRIQEVIENAGHWHVAPFVMGTYHMENQTMRMNDVSLSDPWMAYLMVNGGLEGFAMPFLRGLYYVGRSSWWRHESIHARHHHQMAYFLDATDKDKGRRNWQSRFVMDEAALTIHEAGIEELLTRWQSLKESKGLREKATSSLALLFYLEYAPFTGVRNMFIDSKEATLDLISDGKVRIPLKLAATAAILFGPSQIDDQTHFVDAFSDVASNILPVTDKQVEKAFWRGNFYVSVAAISALFSSKEKGVFSKKEDEGERLPTAEYKFPYVYNPVTSLTRSLGFLHYLSKVWDLIPNYRLVESTAGIDSIKADIDSRVLAKMGDRQHQFTMRVVEEALRPFEGTGRSSFPQDAYVKGMFIPAMYLKLRELYS